MYLISPSRDSNPGPVYMKQECHHLVIFSHSHHSVSRYVTYSVCKASFVARSNTSSCVGALDYVDVLTGRAGPRPFVCLPLFFQF